MNNDILYDNEEQKCATERVLATIRVQTINKEVDELLAEVLKYATNIDTILERNNETKRYLERVATISGTNALSLDEDLSNLDFRVREVIEDFIKRINTRINLIKADTELTNEIETTYDLTDADLEKDIDIAKLRDEDFA